MTTIICPYCNQPGVRRLGADIRPENSALSDRVAFVCEPCDAIAWCPAGATVPDRAMANKALRDARNKFAGLSRMAAWHVDPNVTVKTVHDWIAREMGKEAGTFRMIDLSPEEVTAGIAKMETYLAGPYRGWKTVPGASRG